MEGKIIRNFTDFGNRKWIDRLPGGKGDDKTPEDFDPDDISIGTAVQGEHTNNPDIATEIALDHLSEDPEYYNKLIGSKIADEDKAKDLYNKLKDRHIRNKTREELIDNMDPEELDDDEQNSVEKENPKLYPKGWKDMDGMFMNPNNRRNNKNDDLEDEELEIDDENFDDEERIEERVKLKDFNSFIKNNR